MLDPAKLKSKSIYIVHFTNKRANGKKAGKIRQATVKRNKHAKGYVLRIYNIILKLPC